MGLEGKRFSTQIEDVVNRRKDAEKSFHFKATCAVVHENGSKTVFVPRNRGFSGKKRRAGWAESYFYSYFRRLQKAAENMGFFSRLTPQIEIFCALPVGRAQKC